MTWLLKSLRSLVGVVLYFLCIPVYTISILAYGLTVLLMDTATIVVSDKKLRAIIHESRHSLSRSQETFSAKPQEQSPPQAPDTTEPPPPTS